MTSQNGCQATALKQGPGGPPAPKIIAPLVAIIKVWPRELKGVAEGGVIGGSCWGQLRSRHSRAQGGSSGLISLF